MAGVFSIIYSYVGKKWHILGWKSISDFFTEVMFTFSLSWHSFQCLLDNYTKNNIQSQPTSEVKWLGQLLHSYTQVEQLS